MSGEGPESIPTSADPRSRRPTKKRALTPVSAQSASVTALFARPDQEIRIPAPPPSSSSSTSRSAAAGGLMPPPPEIVTNVQGSSAGAGSGEFHVYKASRRREYERLRRMDEEARRERADADFARDRAARDRRDEDRTRRNREKREKMRARKARQGKGEGGGAAPGSQGDANADADASGGGNQRSAVSGGVKGPRVDVKDDGHEDAADPRGAEKQVGGGAARAEPAVPAPAPDAAGEMPGIVIAED